MNYPRLHSPFCGAINCNCVSIFVMSNAMSVITPVAAAMRRITEQDNAGIAAVIREVSAEYGLTAMSGRIEEAAW